VAVDVSVSSFRSKRMAPSALALAALLHVLLALALWWMAQDRPPVPAPEEPIDITVERPTPPEPKPPASKPAPPAQPADLGLPPPAELTAEKPTQVPTVAQQPTQPLPPQPPSTDDPKPAPPQMPPPRQQAMAEPPKPELKPEPSPLPQAPDGLKPPAKPSLPAQRPPLHPVPLRPSPLSSAPQYPPSAMARREEPSPSPFVNPADAYNRATVSTNYRWQIVRRLQGYTYEAHVDANQGTTVVQVVIARDGRLLDVRITRSSGVPAFDAGVLEGVRAGSPYDPLPDSIAGQQATFTLPLTSVRRLP